ncbi:Neprilysin-4 [Eumeta japonica]|uniref:Neprilysin-4 n=1 Tax=Eumeta variegata TaxID=151549 RepID=A0A4C2A7J3_EUMVA|nr:Neprilysin-4 [Eumeta japonica]
MRNWNKRSWNWQGVLVKLHANCGVSPLFAVTVAKLPGTNETCFHLKPSGLGLPDPSFYNGGSESKPVKAYKAFLKDAALTLDASSADAVFFADDVFAFEQRLATVMAEDMFKEKVYTLAELNEAEKSVSVMHLHRVPPAGCCYESKKKDLPRWEFCTDFVLEAMPLASLALLEDDPEVNLNNDDTSNESVQRVFETVCTAAVNQITTSSNLDENYKSLALKEIDGLTLQIGLKSHAKTHDFLNNYYSQLSVQIQNFFANLNNILDFERRLIQQSYIYPKINIIRETSKHLVQMKVVYDRFVRAVIIPASLLQSPYYHDSYPRDVQYARIGVPIGKAIAEAIDVTDQNTGASLKKYGAKTIYCLHGLLSNTTRWIGTRDEIDVVAKTAYLEVIGGTLAELASQRTEEEHSLLPELEEYSGDGLLP